MKKPAIPANEVERTAAVDALAMVHSPAEERFDRITRLACRLFDVPISLVTLISRDKQWFKSAQGLGVPETPRDVAFCAHAINHDELLLVEDARVHPDFHDHPAVTDDPHVRFYAGQPIQYQGQLVGTLCLVDYVPGTLTEEQKDTLRSLAAWVENELRVEALSAEQTQLLEELDEARRNALIDPLTKAWNRQGMDVLMQRELAVAQRSGSDVCVMLVDVDYYKQVNDRYGHVAGDEVLREVAQRLRGAVRPQDVVARYGGDEFLVFAAQCPAEMGQFLARRLVERVSGRPVTAEGVEIPLTLSIGVTAANAGPGVLATKLVNAADQALYETKAAGRNGMTFRAFA